MNIYVAFAIFSVMILVYWVISELFAILFRFTGLPDDKARFQVLSLLTGCGFTTRESEMIVANRARRTLARITMLFGYVFNITIVSTFINVLFSLKVSQAGNTLIGVLIPLGAVAVIFIFMRFPLVRAWGDRKLERFANRIIHRDTGNTVVLLDTFGSETIALVTLNHIPAERENVPLSEMGLRAETGIMVMLVEHQGERPTAAGADTVFHEGDRVTVFGNYATICRVFEAHERFSLD